MTGMELRALLFPRHCERSEAIHAHFRERWIASSLALLAMTVPAIQIQLSNSERT
jgi:hypothetical protein